MKKLFIILLAICITTINVFAQSTHVSNVNTFKPGAEVLLKGGVGFVKGGMPIPFSFATGPNGGAVTNGTINYPKLKPGLNAGLDFNYYWNSHFGVSTTFDYFSNKYKLLEVTAPFNAANITITQKNQTNTFVGLGVIGRTYLTNKLSGSLGLYGGYLFHKKNSYQADYTVAPFGTATIMKFSGNKPVSAIATKASLRFAYDINPNIAVSLGAEYIMPYFSTKQYSTGLLDNASLGYAIHSPIVGQVFTSPQRSFDSAYISRKSQLAYQQRVESTDKLRLFAFNIGIKFRIGGKTTKTPRTKKGKDCCGTCPVYGLGVTARDKFTKEVLPNTDIAIKNTKGEIVKTGRTNSFGVIVFEKIVKDDYTISGLLNNVALENSSINATEMICDEVIQKEVIYGDRNFIITGKAVVCNSTTPISGINVTLENKDLAFKRSTMTDANGNFVLQLPETGTYDLYGRKESYFSQVEKVSSSDYKREKTLFVKLEICAEKADCGQAINLKNILFDLDKYVIKEAAKKELNRLVQFMQDNPSVKVELSSHTDCRNTAAYNQTLSENRAKASVDYVVSQGISRDRLIGVGYGEAKLLNRCADGVNCSEAEHSINRRTEMKVICPDK